jgi:glycosyltransferase involved in cell wall biosynthesis
MDVVMVAPFARYPKGTTRGRVLPLARALAGYGHRVTVLVPPYDHPEESGARYQVGDAQVETLCVEEVPETSWRQAVMQPRLAAALVRRALALRPDVIHVFKPKAVSGITQLLLWQRRRLLGGPLGRLLGSGPGSKSGNTVNSGRPLGPAIVLDTDDWEGHGGWNEYERYPEWQKYACDWQERWGLRHADAVTAASKTLQAQAWSHRVPPGRVRYVPNGLSPDDYPGWEDGDGARGRRRMGIGLDEPVLLLYTRFFEFEAEHAWRVLELVRERRAGVRVLVVGSGKYQQERQLAALATQAGQADAVVVAGWQEPEALPDLLLAGDVALFPAEDNLANRAKCSAKVLELLWLCRPVVADAVGQYAEYVQDGVSGLLSAAGSPETMAAAALRLLDDRDLARRLAEAGRRRVLEDLRWDLLARGAEEAYGVAAVHVQRQRRGSLAHRR